jgi:site-specific DNA recombinase
LAHRGGLAGQHRLIFCFAEVYVGEVVYRGEVHRGEHEPILDRDLFAAVQAKLAANAVARQVRLRGSPAILTGRIFDDRGNRMSPTHSNKLGVRYRYYVSHAILQQRKAEAGSIARVAAPEIETLVLGGVREHLSSIDKVEDLNPVADRDLIERHVERVIVNLRHWKSTSFLPRRGALTSWPRASFRAPRSGCHGLLRASLP